MELTKLKKRAKVCAVICFMISAVFLITCIVSPIISPFLMPDDATFKITCFVSSIFLCVLTLLIMGNALLMLIGVLKDDSPFTMKNVRRLRWMGWALIAFEPLQRIIQIVQEQAMRAVLYAQAADGESIAMTVTRSSLGGLLVIVGLAVLCISMVFRYGVELQVQADETL